MIAAAAAAASPSFDLSAVPSNCQTDVAYHARFLEMCRFWETKTTGDWWLQTLRRTRQGRPVHLHKRRSPDQLLRWAIAWFGWPQLLLDREHRSDAVGLTADWCLQQGSLDLFREALSCTRLSPGASILAFMRLAGVRNHIVEDKCECWPRGHRPAAHVFWERFGATLVECRSPYEWIDDSPGWALHYYADPTSPYHAGPLADRVLHEHVLALHRTWAPDVAH